MKVFWPILSCSKCTSCTGILLFFDNKTNHSFQQNLCVWFCFTKMMYISSNMEGSLHLHWGVFHLFSDKAQKNGFLKNNGITEAQELTLTSLGFFSWHLLSWPLSKFIFPLPWPWQEVYFDGWFHYIYVVVLVGCLPSHSSPCLNSGETDAVFLFMAVCYYFTIYLKMFILYVKGPHQHLEDPID